MDGEILDSFKTHFYDELFSLEPEKRPQTSTDLPRLPFMCKQVIHDPINDPNGTHPTFRRTHTIWRPIHYWEGSRWSVSSREAGHTEWLQHCMINSKKQYLCKSWLHAVAMGFKHPAHMEEALRGTSQSQFEKSPYGDGMFTAVAGEPKLPAPQRNLIAVFRPHPSLESCTEPAFGYDPASGLNPENSARWCSERYCGL